MIKAVDWVMNSPRKFPFCFPYHPLFTASFSKMFKLCFILQASNGYSEIRKWFVMLPSTTEVCCFFVDCCWKWSLCTILLVTFAWQSKFNTHLNTDILSGYQKRVFPLLIRLIFVKICIFQFLFSSPLFSTHDI